MTLTPDEVGTIQDEYSAARAWLELEHERNNANLPQGRQRGNKEATAKLEQSWPGAKGLAAVASEEQLGGLSPAMKRTRDAHRKSSGVNSQQARQQRRSRTVAKPSPTGKPGKPATPKSSPSRSSARRGGGVSLPLFSDAADWAAPTGLSYAQIAWQTFGWGIGLSVLYLFLTKGTGAVNAISRGITNTVDVLVNPLADPLSPHGTAVKSVVGSSGQPNATAGASLQGTATLGGLPSSRQSSTVPSFSNEGGAQSANNP